MISPCNIPKFSVDSLFQFAVQLTFIPCNIYCVGALNTFPLSTSTFNRKNHSDERMKTDLFDKIYFLLTSFDSCHIILSQLTLHQGSVLLSVSIKSTIFFFTKAVLYLWLGHNKRLVSSSQHCLQHLFFRQLLKESFCLQNSSMFVQMGSRHPIKEPNPSCWFCCCCCSPFNCINPCILYQHNFN